MKIKPLVDNNRWFLLLVAVFFISEIIVNPIGNFPLNDDWSYGKAEMLLHRTGEVNIGDFPAMTLVTHLMWGAIFTKIFGFSFTVLRFSTIISAIIGLFFLNKLVTEITGNKLTAVLACFVLLYNPLYFNLVNTYMTDVSFATLMILCCYFAYDFFKNKKTLSFVLVFVLSALLVLLRQFGIIVPVSFAISCLFLRDRKLFYFGLALLMNALVLVALKSYESHLKPLLGSEASYKFSGKIDFMQGTFWETSRLYLIFRYKAVLLHVLLYPFPFVVLYIKSLVKGFKAYTILLVSALSIGAVYYFFEGERFPIGNIFANTNVGAETFFQTLHPDYRPPHEHTYSETMNSIAMAIKYSFISVTVICMVLFLLKMIKLKYNPLRNPFLVFLTGFFFAYGITLFVPESFTDRYHIPLIIVMLIFLSFANRYYQINYRFAILPILFFFYISTFGTKDYLELNRTRWEAYDFLKNAMHVDYQKINGGFEVNCWNEGNNCVWYAFLSHKSFDYMIQYQQEKGFRVLREYEFQRYFPYKKDKIYIFANEHKKEE